MSDESLRCRLVRRLAVVGAALAIVLAVGLVLALRGGSSGNKPVAHVGGEPITKSQPEAVVAPMPAVDRLGGETIPAPNFRPRLSPHHRLGRSDSYPFA